MAIQYYYAVDDGAGATRGLDLVRGPFPTLEEAHQQSRGNAKAGNLWGIFSCPDDVGDGQSWADLIASGVARRV